MTTGRPWAAAKSAAASAVAWLQPGPPMTISGALAAASISPTFATSAAAGAATGGVQGFRSATRACSERVSSGRASTTGPGRPDMATAQARPMNSGIRSALSIWATHLAMGPNIWR